VKRTVRVADYRRTLHNVWGLSLGLESQAESETRRLLLDFGYTPDTLVNNIELLGIQPSKLDAMIVSHGHFDHYGGLIGFLQTYRSQMKPEIALYVGGEDNFCHRVVRTPEPGMFSEGGTLDRREIAAQKVNLVFCEKPTVIAGHAFTTGAIKRASFEKVLPNTLVEYSKRDGLGCDLAHFAPQEMQGKPVPDEHIHEHATCFNLKDRGLVVISSCGHAGIINSIRQAMEVSGVKKLHALVGGFHLAPAPDDYLKQSVAELKALNPDAVIPMHCSGTNFINEVRAQMPDRLALSSTGSEFVLGA
jgi:7,8-dihydropterin-6-yl-methyl-4-(beta-D-ribofuranosyl)aminobenzene 5'-phosphate synthase